MLPRHSEMHSEKMYNTHPLILIKFRLNKGVNYTQDFMVLTLTNIKKQTKYNPILEKKRLPCGWPDYEFLKLIIGEWLS